MTLPEKPEPLFSVDFGIARRLIKDSAPTPPPRVRLMHRLRAPGAGEWLLDVLRSELERQAGGAGGRTTPRLGPAELPEPAQLLALKAQGKRLLHDAHSPEDVERSAALYFAGVALFAGHPDTPPSERGSSLPSLDLDEVLYAIGCALGPEWAPVLDRAHDRIARTAR